MTSVTPQAHANLASLTDSQFSKPLACAALAKESTLECPMSGSHAGIEHDESMEQELQSQLLEQQAALEQVQEALQEGGEDTAELQQMTAELKTAIQELEAALLEMKRARLLATVAAAQQGQQELSKSGITHQAAAAAGSSVPLVLLPPSPQAAADAGVVNGGVIWPAGVTGHHPVDESLQGSGTAATVPVGAACRFRGEDGRWYQGHVHSIEGSWAHMKYDMPTQRYMLQGCRVLASSLRGPRSKLSRATYEVGDVVYIRPSSLEGLQGSIRPAGRAAGDVLWPAADVVEVDDMRSIATVQLQDGRRLQLEFEAITLGAHAGCSDLDAHTDSSDDDHSSTDADSAGAESSSSGEGEQELEAEGHSGLGSSLDTLGHARLALAAGVHTGTRHFASWETHTRGIASKLMAKMGYKAGTGLGSTGQGLTAPVEVLLFNEKSGLGASEGRRPAGHGDHKHLKRKRTRKKAATQAREAREAERETAHQQELAGGAPGLFGFINNALGDKSEAAAAIRRIEHSLLKQDRVRPDERGVAAQQVQGGGSKGAGRAAAAQDSRARLMDMHKAIEGCQAKVAHFQAMLQRNANNVTLAPQIAANLKQAQADLTAAQAEQSRMTNALKKTDHQRKMLKF